jgi:mannose-6-phosphate isomerase class I
MRTTPEPIPGGTREALSRSDFFALERFKLNGPARIGSPDRFTIAMALKGSARILSEADETPLGFGETVLLPASLGQVEIQPDGAATILTCIVP